MKNFKKILLTAILSICSIFAVACGGDKDAEISSVKTDDLKQFYYVTEDVDLNDVTLTVNYSDKTKKTLTKGEVDKELSSVKADTEFILYNKDNLHKVSGFLPVGTYTIEYLIIGEMTEKATLMTITVNTNQSLAYDLDSFAAPEFVTTFKSTVASSTDEAKFYDVDTNNYYVGDDNEFIFKPLFEVSDKDGEPADINLNTTVKVERKDGENIWTEVGSDFYTYNPATYGIDFNDEKACGKTFRITSKPTDFSTDLNGQTASTSFVVNVMDGWNVTKAKDLGMMNIYDPSNAEEANDKSNVNYRGDYNMSEQDKYKWDTNTMWTSFLGITNSKSINGIFVHNKIDVTKDDIPSWYFVKSQAEGENSSAFSVGSLRDYATLYTKYLGTKDFNFVGNYFTIDFSNLPIGLSNGDGDYYYQSADDTNIKEGHSRTFQFCGNVIPEGQTEPSIVNGKVYFKNANIVGNIKYNSDKSKVYTNRNATETLRAEFACGGIIGVTTRYCEIDVSNVLAKNMYFSLYADSHSTMSIDKAKVYDNFNCAFFSWRSEGNTIENSEFKRFGGPAIFLCSGVNSDGVSEGNSSVEIDKNTIVENFVQGSEAWFSLYGATPLVTNIIAQNPTGYGLDMIYYRVVTESKTEFLTYSELADRGLVTGRSDEKLGTTYPAYLNLISLGYTDPMDPEHENIYSLIDYSAKYPFETAEVINKYNRFMSIYAELETILTHYAQQTITPEEAAKLEEFTQYVPMSTLTNPDNLSAVQTAFGKVMAGQAGNEELATLMQYTPGATRYFLLKQMHDQFVGGGNVCFTSNGCVPGVTPDSFDATDDDKDLLYFLINARGMGMSTYALTFTYFPYAE